MAKGAALCKAGTEGARLGNHAFDAERCHPLLKGSRQALQPELGRGVCPEAREGHDAPRAGDVHHCAAVLLAHDGQHLLRSGHGAEEVGLQGPPGARAWPCYAPWPPRRSLGGVQTAQSCGQSRRRRL
eukprot:scaffold2656_cov227-Pinguiococcus_pyrenoidosus.AAC.2